MSNKLELDNSVIYNYDKTFCVSLYKSDITYAIVKSTILSVRAMTDNKGDHFVNIVTTVNTYALDTNLPDKTVHFFAENM